MPIKSRPNINVKLIPTNCTYAASNKTSNKTNLGNRYAYQVIETSTGVRRRKPKGSWINPTNYTFTRVEWQACTGTARYMPSGYPNSLGQYYTGVVGVLSGEGITRFDLANTLNPVLSETSAKLDDGLRNVALIAARNKIKSGSVNLGVAYGERKKTAQHLGDTATRIANSFRNLKRGNVRKAMDELGVTSKKRAPRGGNVPQKWLELQYAWNPLLGEVYSSCESLANRNRDDWRVTAKATRSKPVEIFHEYQAYEAGWGYRGVRGRKSVYVRIDAVPENELLISLSSLGILNPLEVAWELVPLSFVVDWAWPIGNYLDSLDAMLGYTSRGYSSSLFVELEWTCTGIGTKTWSSGAKKVENYWTGGKKMVYLDRQAGTSTPLPTVPGFKDPSSLGHMANGLALLASAFGRTGMKSFR